MVTESEETENQEIISDKKDMSADDIFGGENLEESESSEEIEKPKESIEEEIQDEKSDSEEADVSPEKKKSDNVQKSFFDTFDENQ